MRGVLAAATAVLVAGAGLAGCTAGGSGGGGQQSVSMLATWTGPEAQEFGAVLSAFQRQTGIHVDYVGTRDAPNVLQSAVSAGRPPDVAVVSDPYALRTYAASGVALPLNGVVDGRELERDYPPSWLELMRAGTGQLRALAVKATLKGLIWYSPSAFAGRGLSVPQTWDQLVATSARATRSGVPAWCLGLESSSVSGWPGTDWIEDIVLHESGPADYDRWVAGRLPWTSPQIRSAWQHWAQLLQGGRAVRGGSTNALLTGFGNAGGTLFAARPGCLMEHQASFIMGSYAADKRPDGSPPQPGSDYREFPFPQINPQFANAQEVGGDFVAMFRGTPAARRLIAFLATPQGQVISAHPAPGVARSSDSGSLSVNARVPVSAYGGNPIAAGMAQLVTGQAKPQPSSPSTPVFRFDASDLMPAAMRTAFYHAVLQFVADPSQLGAILDQLDQDRVHIYP